MTASIVFAARLLNALVGFAVGVIIARTLGPSGRAEYFLAATYALGAFAISHFSLDAATFWAVSERRAAVRGLARPLALATLATTGLAGGLYAVAAYGTVLLESVPPATVLAGLVGMPVTMARFVLDALLYATDRARVATVAVVVTAMFQLAAVAVTASTGVLDSAGVIWISTGSTLAGGAVALAGVRRAGRDAAGDGHARVRPGELFRSGLANHLGVIATWTATRVDVVIVSLIVNPRRLGIYSLAITLCEFILLATSSLALAALGRQSALGREESLLYSVSVGADSARIALVEALALAALGWPLIRVAFGREWLDTFPILVAMCPGMVALAYIRPIGAAFVRAGRALEVSLALIVAAMVNVAGTWLAMTTIGLWGAGLVSTIAYGCAALLVAWRTRNTLGVPPWAPSTLVPRLRRRLQIAAG